MITVEELARLSILACEASGADFMLTGALAYNYYAVPRSTKDVDIVVSVPDSSSIGGIIRSKDLDDARDVLAVQGTDFLDMAYIRQWCAAHGTTERLDKALSEIPPM